jgi:hypothetical protein
MSKANATETDILAFLFNLTSMPSYGSTLYLSLHTSDPGESGDQTTNEVTTGAYASYARVGVSRDGAGWVVSGNQSSNAALVQFPQCTGGAGATITHIAIGTLSTGAGQILYSGALNANLNVSNLIQPQFAIGGLAIQED